jgi:hypothetical protein
LPGQSTRSDELAKQILLPQSRDWVNCYEVDEARRIAGGLRSRSTASSARGVRKRTAAPAMRGQAGLLFDDGVVSGMVMTMTSSPAVATIARVRKAAL